MRRFKWIEWNLVKIEAHGLSSREVEAAFGHAISCERRNDGSFKMTAITPAGRRITVIWRYDEDEQGSDILVGLKGLATFVITAF